MSKRVLIKTKYTSIDGREVESFCLLKKKQLSAIRAIVYDFFDNNDVTTELRIPINLDDYIPFYDADSIFADENMEIIPINKDSFNGLDFLFGLEYGECSLVRVYEAIEEQDTIQDVCDCKDDDFNEPSE